jgi:hypothetical protein
VIVSCLTVPPPVLPGVAAPTVCLPGFECFPVEAAMVLADNVEKLKDRVAADWAACHGAPLDADAGTP